ncbi:MAG: flagellar export protein FliJ [Betaproteobacteria bacterium]|nr:flagellar export protein FliJ [Betaproteobacteria bacterium]
MTGQFHLHPLIELARNQLDAAARDLQARKLQWDAQEAKLGQILVYHAEYQGKLRQLSQAGMPVALMRDFRAFLGKLDTALSQQRSDAERAKARWEEGAAHWRLKKRQLDALETLARRHAARQLKAEMRREQRMLDELAEKSFVATRERQEED